MWRISTRVYIQRWQKTKETERRGKRPEESAALRGWGRAGAGAGARARAGAGAGVRIGAGAGARARASNETPLNNICDPI